MSAPFKFVDLAGQRFGKLVAIEYKGQNPHREQTWLCRCDCGGTKTVKGGSLRNGDTRSCGCLPNRGRMNHGEARAGHPSREYRAWCSIKQRCRPSSQKNKAWYADRGIKVCPEWAKSFARFLSDMGRCPNGFQIERKDNSKGYEPGNCVWTTSKKNCRNKRNNRVIRFNGSARTVTEWAELVETPVPTLFSRIYAGWPTEEVLFGRGA